jgi:hypothetical protein
VRILVIFSNWHILLPSKDILITPPTRSLLYVSEKAIQVQIPNIFSCLKYISIIFASIIGGILVLFKATGAAQSTKDADKKAKKSKPKGGRRPRKSD